MKSCGAINTCVKYEDYPQYVTELLILQKLPFNRNRCEKGNVVNVVVKTTVGTITSEVGWGCSAWRFFALCVGCIWTCSSVG